MITAPRPPAGPGRPRPLGLRGMGLRGMGPRGMGLEGMSRSRPARTVVGVIVAAAVVAVVWAIVMAFTGRFTDVVPIRAQLPRGSNAVPVGTPVQYRNVTVGQVSSVAATTGGGVTVGIRLHPQYLKEIPAGVEAQVQPLSIFGNQFVDLVPPRTAAPATPRGHLEAHTLVAAYTGSASSSIQGTATQLYDLLEAVHPAQLDTALTALATALNGEGKALGSALVDASRYTGQAVVPNLSQLSADLRALPAAAGTLDKATPDLLGILSNTSVTARTITGQVAALQAFLGNGADAAGQAGALLQQVQTSLPSLLNEAGPLLADVTQSPTELSRTLSGLTAFASAVASSESHGPYLSLNVTIPVENENAAVDAALGYDNPSSIDQALGSAVNPPTYTSADCPEYPGEDNPYCGGGSPDARPTGGEAAGGSATATTTTAKGSGASPGPAGDLVSTSASDPYTAELAAAQEVASALNGGAPPASPALADLVLVPLLQEVSAP